MVQQTHHVSVCKLKLSSLMPGLMPLLAEVLSESLGQNKFTQLFFFSPGFEEGVGLLQNEATDPALPSISHMQQYEGKGGLAPIWSHASLPIYLSLMPAVTATTPGSPSASTVLPSQVPARAYQIVPVSRQCQQEVVSHPKPFPAPSWSKLKLCHYKK